LLFVKVHLWCRKSGACVDELKLVAQKLRRLPVVDPALPVVSWSSAVCLLLFTSLSACAPVCVHLSVCVHRYVCLYVCLSVCLFVCLAVCWPVCQTESICWRGFCALAKSGLPLSDCAAISVLIFVSHMTTDLPVAAASHFSTCKLFPVSPPFPHPNLHPYCARTDRTSVCLDMCLPVCVHVRLSVHSHRGCKPGHAGCSGGSSQCWQVITGECAVQRGSRSV